jgi:DNA-binding IclR family transcriptional regulator
MRNAGRGQTFRLRRRPPLTMEKGVQGKRRGGREPLGIQSVEVAARILRALAEGGGVMPLRELAAAAGMHRGKVHRYLISLSRAGLVSREADFGHYGIGPLAITAGLAGLNRLDPIRLAYEMLPALAKRIGETVVVAVWGDRGATVIALEDSARPVTLNVRVGSILPLRTSATGRVFAAHLPLAVVRPVLAAEAKRVKDAKSSSTAAFARVLAVVRREGLSAVEGTLIPGLNALAAPVFDQRGKIVLVIGAVGRRETLAARPRSPAAQALKEAAAALSRQLGYSAP